MKIEDGYDNLFKNMMIFEWKYSCYSFLKRFQVLIQEQVNEEAVSFQKDIIQELEEKILELRRIIHDKEYAIQELEKMKPF